MTSDLRSMEASVAPSGQYRPQFPRAKLHGRAFYESLGSPKVILAPMVDQSEFAWRVLTRSFMPPDAQQNLLAYSPMLHARLFCESPIYRRTHFEPIRQPLPFPADSYHQRTFNSASDKTGSDSNTSASYLDGNPAAHDRPLIVQFCANEPSELLEAARAVQPYCDAVDLNLGCPQGIARRGHYGAFLQEDWPLIASLVGTLHQNLDIPVTAKMRILETKERTLEYARMLLDAGASFIAVHGRRREQKGHNTGLADWSFVRYLREHLPPDTVLFANGNVLCHGDIERCLRETGADAVMSAEANLGDPSVFAPPPCLPGTEEAMVNREYWWGRDGKGGYRVDSMMRRYLDVIYRFVLEVNPPFRKPLFRPSDPHTESNVANGGSNDHQEVINGAGVPSSREQRPPTANETAESISCSKNEPNEDTGHPPESQTHNDRPTEDQPASQDAVATTNGHPPKKKPKLNNDGQNSNKKTKKSLQPPSPNLTAMQPHLFHLLRQVVSRHIPIRDALARTRGGDMPSFERILGMLEDAVAEALIKYETSEDDHGTGGGGGGGGGTISAAAGFSEAEKKQARTEVAKTVTNGDDTTASSTNGTDVHHHHHHHHHQPSTTTTSHTDGATTTTNFTINNTNATTATASANTNSEEPEHEPEPDPETLAIEAAAEAAAAACRRPWWICQPHVRPLPAEALRKGAMTVGKREMKKREKENLRMRNGEGG